MSMFDNIKEVTGRNHAKLNQVADQLRSLAEVTVGTQAPPLTPKDNAVTNAYGFFPEHEEALERTEAIIDEIMNQLTTLRERLHGAPERPSGILGAATPRKSQPTTEFAARSGVRVPSSLGSTDKLAAEISKGLE